MTARTWIASTCSWPLAAGLALALAILAGCGREESAPPARAGVAVLPADLAEADEETARVAAMEVVMARPAEELRMHVDPAVDPRIISLPDGGHFGEVFSVVGGMRKFWPRRDSERLPEGLSECWEGFVIDLRAGQPYIVVYPGTPEEEDLLEGQRVRVTGVFIGVREYLDQADRRQRAPVLVTRDIRSMGDDR